MPIEIKELVIRALVDTPAGKAKKTRRRDEKNDGGANALRIRMDELMAMMKNKNER